MSLTYFTKSFFPKDQVERANKALHSLINLALEEDGKDLSAEGIFSADHTTKANIIAKEDSYIVGLELIPIIFQQLFQMPMLYSYADNKAEYCIENHVEEGAFVAKGTVFCTITAPTIALLKAERVILNFITHLSGVANLTAKYVKELENTNTILLDTRKTLPGMRHLEKYATYCAGAKNHRFALDDMIMLKDNHIDALGSITLAVEQVRAKYNPCPPIEVECRDYADVLEAVKLGVERIMLDNFPKEEVARTLDIIPLHIEAEISGNVSLENIRATALLAKARKADYISVGKITHSAPSADFSLKTLTN